MSTPHTFDGATQREERYLPTALFFGLQGVGPYVFIDREELRIRQTKSENGEAFARYASDPGRYVPVRAFSPRMVSQLTLEALQGLLPEEELWGLPSDDPRWGAQLLGRLDPDARALAKREFTGVLVRLAESWLAEMNIPSDGIILVSTEPRAELTNAPPPPAPPNNTDSPALMRVRDPRLFIAALQDRSDKGWFLHLTTFRLVEALIGPEGVGVPVSDEEWSWLRVPPIPTHRQLEHAIQHISPERRSELTPKLRAAGHQWSVVLSHSLTDSEQTAFNEARTALVVNHLEDWMTTHQIPIDKFIGPNRRYFYHDTPTRAPLPQARSRDPLTALRARLHTIIDQMSLEELSALPIPARCLLL